MKKMVCEFCGKRAKRYCPAVKANICPLCCGMKRGTEIECTADCRFFPFSPAGYDGWLKIDLALMPKLVSHVAREAGEMHLRSVLDSFPLERSGSPEAGEDLLYFALQHCLLVERDEKGRTLADRWAANDWAGLRPDEAMMMEYRSASFVTVVEIQRVLDSQTLECIDLFDPEGRPFAIVDRSLPARMTRFSRVLGWLTHYPHFSKLGHCCHEIPQIVYREFVDHIRRRAGEAPDATGGTDCRGYASANLRELLSTLFRMPREKMKAMFENMDSNHCVGSYEIGDDHEEVKRILEEKPEFAWEDRDPDEGDPPETVYYAWQRLGESQEIEEDMPAAFRTTPGSDWVGSLGELRLTEDRLVFETYSRQKFEFGSRMIQRYFGTLVRQVDEKVTEMARQIARKWDEESDRPGGRREEDLAGQSIPPAVRAELTEKFYADHYAKFIDDPIPALDGMTPREASRDPEARQRLVELMKEHVHSIAQMNREQSCAFSLSSLLKELGLDELLD